MTYHDFQPDPSKKCAVCKKSRLHSIHFMPERIDRDMSRRMREQENKPWSIDKSPWEGTAP